MSDIAALAVHYIDKGRMIHRVVAGRLRKGRFCVIDPISFGDLLDLFGRPCKPHKGGMEVAHIPGHRLDIVTLRVDGDKERLDLVGVLAQHIERGADCVKLRGANIRAKSKAEIDNQIATPESAFVDWRTLMVNQVEGASHRDGGVTLGAAW